MYVYKEVWVHPSSRWLWLVQDFAGHPEFSRATGRESVAGRRNHLSNGSTSNRGALVSYTASAVMKANGAVTIRLTASGSGRHSFAIRSDNLAGDLTVKRVTLRAGRPFELTWKAKTMVANTPWVAVMIPDEQIEQRRELFGHTGKR